MHLRKATLEKLARNVDFSELHILQGTQFAHCWSKEVNKTWKQTPKLGKVHSFLGVIAFLQHAPKKSSPPKWRVSHEIQRNRSNLWWTRCREHATSQDQTLKMSRTLLFLDKCWHCQAEDMCRAFLLHNTIRIPRTLLWIFVEDNLLGNFPNKNVSVATPAEPRGEKNFFLCKFWAVKNF